jgi:membrane associated rhomboid family serine protease
MDTLVAVAEAARLTCYRHPNRETGVSCPDCGRGLCPDCMVFTPVGIKCAEHAGIPQGAAKAVTSARRIGIEGTGALLTKALIAVNVGIFLFQVGSGGGTLSSPRGGLFERFALYGPLVAQGEWWRLIGAAFLHANLIHLAMNMLFLWWIGAPVEEALGRARYALLYVVSGLAGSAGALLLDPAAVTVGASGALFGILGAAFVFERQRMYVLGGGALTIIVLNLALTFTISGISIGGHLGGLVGGALAALALSRLGRAHAAYGRPGIAGIAGVVAVGVASVAIAFWSVGDFA